MGMYDYINGEQVKCFYSPIYDESKDGALGGTWHSGGNLRGFGDSSELPLSTFYYKYPKNFIIFDYNFDLTDAILHIIKDGKVFKTLEKIEELSDLDFTGNEMVVGYYGIELNIKSVQDMKDFLGKKNVLENTKDELRKKAKIAYNEFNSKFRELNHLRKTKENVFDLIVENDLVELDELLKQFLGKEITVDLIASNKADILIKEDLLNKLTEVVENRLVKEFNDLADVHDVKHNKYLKDIEPFSLEFSNKWIKSEFESEKQFGEYLDCLLYLDKQKEEECPVLDNKYIYENCLATFKNFILSNEGIVERYLNWVDLTDEEKEEVKDICNLIVGN